MRPATCHLLAAVDILEPCPGKQCPFYEDTCMLTELHPQLARAAEKLPVPALVSELWVHPRDTRVGLNGSGLLIVNPPYQLDLEMHKWLPELGGALGAGPKGGSLIRWIAHEQH